MSEHETQHEQTAEAPASETAPGAGVPASGLEQLAGLVGNTAFAQLVARRAVPPQTGETSRTTLARSLNRLGAPAAPVLARQDDEQEDRGLNDG